MIRSGTCVLAVILVKFAYIVTIGQYMKIEKLPSGKGIADLAYVPKRYSPLPGMIIELKWDQSSERAISQIKDKNYPAIIKQYEGELLLVGIDYDPESKTHGCKIERIQV